MFDITPPTRDCERMTLLNEMHMSNVSVHRCIRLLSLFFACATSTRYTFDVLLDWITQMKARTFLVISITRFVHGVANQIPRCAPVVRDVA